MIYKRITNAVLAAVLALPLMAQPPAAGTHRGRMGFAQGRMGAALNLTDAQKEQAKAIFSAGSEERRQLQTQLRDAGKALHEAVKTNQPDAEIDRLAATVGNLEAQRTAFHAKQQKKFFSILTDEQKQKLATSAAEHHRRGPRAQQ
jgi:Spy/CpxP family protein refolding chaperone